MADRSFEIRLDRLFAETPAFADAELFAARLESRIDRGWNTRQLLIGGLGLIGGLIGGAQVLGSGLIVRLAAVSAQSNIAVPAKLTNLAATRFLPAGFPINGEVFWMSAALAILAAGFAISRVIREI
ncbi:MAG: hypothetical protein ACYC8V_07040 [Caulobacteraceae bacterium]